ncbi:MAG: tol-pal system YbgF family protein [Mariniblastus sp.]
MIREYLTRTSNRTAVSTLTIVLGIALVFACPPKSQAQEDVVVTRRASKQSDGSSNGTIKRKGTIVEWRGLSLTIDSSGTEREIDNDEIVQIQTTWSEEFTAGQKLFQNGQAKEAATKLQAALSKETRAWAKRIIRAELVEALCSIEQHSAAAEHFLLILQDDPNTRFIHLAPLVWTGAGTALNRPAQQWIQSNNPTIQLMGASWLLVGADRQNAINVLDELTRDIDPNIQSLAIAQLWRSRSTTNAKQTAVWQNIVDKMPRAIRAGPYLVLANAQSKAGQNRQATLNLMRVPILYPDQRSLSAAALYHAGKLLRSSNDPSSADTVFGELKTRFPQTVWAQQAANSLQLK